jgi:hypothetical protein
LMQSDCCRRPFGFTKRIEFEISEGTWWKDRLLGVLLAATLPACHMYY